MSVTIVLGLVLWLKVLAKQAWGGILGLGGGTGLGLIDQFSSNCLIILIRNINFYHSFLL